MSIKVDSDKISRAYAVTPVLDNMAAFPNAVYDDEVDSTTQALNYMIGRGGAAGTGVFEYYRDVASNLHHTSVGA